MYIFMKAWFIKTTLAQYSFLIKCIGACVEDKSTYNYVSMAFEALKPTHLST